MANLSNINNKFIVESDGDVGIGVTTALDKLNVGDGNIRISQVGNVASQLILNTYQSALGNTTYKWFVGQTTSANSYSFQIGNGTTPYLHINSLLFGAAAGNVGIGTTSPDAKLDVESTVDYQIMAKYNATNYTEYGYYGLNVVGGGNPYLFKLQGTERIRITSAGNIQFAQDGYINTNTADASDNLSLQLSGGGAFGDTRGACISLAGNENGNGGLMQLRAGDGSVGGIRYYTGGSERMRLGGRLISFNSTTGVQEIRGDVASAKFAIGNMGDASSQMMVSSRGFLTLNTSNTGSALDATERMRIKSDGNILIADTRQIQFYNTDQYIRASSTNDLEVVAGDDINYRSNFSRFFSGSAEHARLTGVGAASWVVNGSATHLFGVGLTNPSTKLTVKDSQDSSLYSGLKVERSANTTGAYLNVVGGALNLNTDSSMPLKFRILNSSMQTINTDGGRAYAANASGLNMKEYGYNFTAANGVTVDLIENTNAHSDIAMVQISITAYHSSRTFFAGMGTFGGYGFHLTGAGNGLGNGGLTSTITATGKRKLQWYNGSGYNAVVRLYIQVRTESGITVLNGTLSNL